MFPLHLIFHEITLNVLQMEAHRRPHHQTIHPHGCRFQIIISHHKELIVRAHCSGEHEHDTRHWMCRRGHFRPASLSERTVFGGSDFAPVCVCVALRKSAHPSHAWSLACQQFYAVARRIRRIIKCNRTNSCFGSLFGALSARNSIHHTFFK